jgi:hypothetical protein
LASRSENCITPLSLQHVIYERTLPQKFDNLNGSDPLVSLPVDPAKRCVGLKLLNVSKALSFALNLQLLFGNSLEEVPESVLGFDSKHYLFNDFKSIKLSG